MYYISVSGRAVEVNRTPVFWLEARSNSHYTTTALIICGPRWVRTNYLPLCVGIFKPVKAFYALQPFLGLD